MKPTKQKYFNNIGLFVFLLLILGSIQINAAESGKPENPVIFNYNEGALPSEVLGVQGHSFGTNSQLWYSVVSESDTQILPSSPLKTLSSSDIFIASRLPGEDVVSTGKLIAIWVKNESGESTPVFINRARIMSVEFKEIMPGNIFRVFGRNLHYAGQKPELYLVDAQTKQSYKTEVLLQNKNYLQVRVPKEIKTGQNYLIQVSNGAGGDWGKSLADEKIFVREIASDPFNLKVPWGSDFNFSDNVYNLKSDSRLKIKAKGDGKKNDRDAIQQAIDLATANGGGVVYFPKGIYKIEFEKGCGLTMKSKVVLKGEGPDESIIQYGFGKPQPYIDPIGKSGWPDETVDGVAFLWPLGVKLSGLLDLGVKNVNSSGLWRHSLKNMRSKEKFPGSAGSEYFAVNCHFDLSMDWGLSWSFVDKMLVSGCVFESKAQVTWPWLWHCDGSTNFVIRENRVRYSAGRFGFSESYNGIIENNHITRLGDLQTAKGETGGFNIDYAKDIIVMNNHMDVEGEAIRPQNQGETILSQGCNPVGQTVGKVSSATALTITDLEIDWPTFGTNEKNEIGEVNASIPSYSNAIAIVNGKGMGQWRYITENDSDQLKVDRPWDVIPEKGSQYVIMKWSAEDWLVLDNVLEDNNRGIWFYGGGNDVIIKGNKLVNSEGIYLRSDQRLKIGRYNLVWDFLVEENHVSRNNDKRPAYISSALAVLPNDKLVGTGTLGVEIRRNYVQALKPNVSGFVRGEGYWNSSVSKTPDALDETIGILGTVFENNTAVNSDFGYRLNKSAYQTIVDNPLNVEVDNLFNESEATGTILDYYKTGKGKINDPFKEYITGKAPELIEDLGEEVEDGVKLRKLIFHSYNYQEDGVNKKASIFAVIARPEKDGKYPGLLVLHGGGGCAEIDKAKKWAALGYVAVALDEPGVANPEKIPMSHGPWEKYKYGKNRFVVKPELKSSTLFSAVLASLQGFYLLQSQPDVIDDKLGITGISWGGYLTTFISGLVSSDVAASFSVYGCGFYDFGSTFLKSLNLMDPVDRTIWLEFLDAGRRVESIKTPFFIAAAANDNWFYPPAVTQTLKKIKGKSNHLFAPNNSHKVELLGGTENRSPEDPGWLSMQKTYFNYHLKGEGSSMPKISKIESIKLDNGNTQVRFKVSSRLPVENAQVNYSVVGKFWPKRVWEKVSAKISMDGWYEAEIPSSGLKQPFECYATISDNRPVSVSSFMIWCH